MKRFAVFSRAISREARSLACAAGMALGAGSCGPDVGVAPELDLPSDEGAEYATALCEALARCGCGLPSGSVAACEQEHHARFDESLLAGYRVVRSCFESWRVRIEDDPCGEEPQVAGALLECAQLRGTRREGEACEVLVDLPALRVDECAEGLLCRDARCIETPQSNAVPLIHLDEGEPCGPTYVGFCFGIDGLFCDSDVGVCRQKLDPGAVCSAGSACDSCSDSSAQGLYSCERADDDEPGSCQSAPARGEPCDPRASWACGTCDDVAWCDPVSLICGAIEDVPAGLCLWAYQ